MKKYYIYILECDNKMFYTGVTNNLERRILEHNNGIDRSCFTFNKRPVKLVWFAETNNIEYAIQKEKQIKKWSRNKKIALIHSDYERLRYFSKSNDNK